MKTLKNSTYVQVATSRTEISFSTRRKAMALIRWARRRGWVERAQNYVLLNELRSEVEVEDKTGQLWIFVRFTQCLCPSEMNQSTSEIMLLGPLILKQFPITQRAAMQQAMPFNRGENRRNPIQTPGI